jgi:hypothetical protein
MLTLELKRYLIPLLYHLHDITFNLAYTTGKPELYLFFCIITNGKTLYWDRLVSLLWREP